ncbi:glycosyl transferase [Cyanosarcina cf. burmensis CCALA 770]|nr:glycosyl transferase [Cyanosarcina cf. burmensis CCALA 770]
MNGSPEVAICIPTCNQSQYLPESVSSAYQQTYPNIEVWVSDDASSDRTPEVVSQLRTQYPTLKAFRHSQNLGISGNPSWLLRQPKTQYIARLDSDDLIQPNYLEVLVSLLEKFPEAGYAHAAVQQIDENGKVARTRRLARTTGFQSAEEYLRSSVYGNRSTANILLFRRQALESAGFFIPGMNYCDDWGLAVRIADAGWGNVYASKVLASYRIWSDVKKVRPKRSIDYLRGCIRVFEKDISPAFDRRSWDTKIIHQQRRQMAIHQAAVLDSPLFTDVERTTIVQLLKELGDCPALQLRLKLLQLGFGAYFNWQKQIEVGLKDRMKQWLSPWRDRVTS